MAIRTRSKILVAISAIFTLALIVILTFDWNLLKPYIESEVTASTGRQFMIRGNLDVSLSLNPRISAEGISLANADWGTEQPMVGVNKIAFRISLLDLLKGDIVLPEISISQPTIALEKSEEGKRNWDLKKTEKETELPKIGRLNIDQGKLVYRDPKSETDIIVEIFSDSAASDARATPINVVAEGKISGLNFASRIRGGELISLTDKTRPYPIRGNAQIGTTHAAFDGTITGLEALAEMDMKLEIQGDDLSALYPIVGIAIFPSPPYHIAGRLLHQKTQWNFKEFTGEVGKSDLNGDVLFDTGGKRPMLRADVVSKVLDLEDLSGFMGARRGPKPEDSPAEKQEKKASIEAQRDRMLPDEEFKVDRLRAMDADVKFTGQTIRNKNLPIEHLEAHLKIDDGLLTMDPVNFAVAGGNIITNVTVNARKEIPVAQTRVEFRKLQLSKLFPKIEITHSSKGVIGGITQLKGEGKSVGALLATSDGRVGLIISGGEMSEMLLAGLDLDGGELLKLLFTGDKTVPIRCAVVDFDVKKGLMKSDAFVIDTTETNVLGEGHIRLADETIKMTLSPQPKDFSILSLRTPIHISGTFKKPRILPDKILALRISASVLLGVLATPLASLIPLIEMGPGEDNDCNALIASVKKHQPPAKETNQAQKF
ncbi:MAG: AsmA family protein [Nitrosospira sp.]